MSLAGVINLQINTQLAKALDMSSAADALSQVIKAFTISDGTGINAANQIWHDERSLNTATSETINVYNPGVNALGDANAMVKVKAVIIHNKSATAGEKLKLGGEGTANAWSAPFDSSNTAKVICGPDGTIALVDPSAAGYVAGSSSNNLLKIENVGAGTITYQIFIIGANA